MLFALGAVIVIWLVCAHGCASWVAHALVKASNHGRRSFQPEENLAAISKSHRLATPPRALHLAVGPPDASLSAWIIEPSHVSTTGGQPRGTILVLHGIRDSKRSQVGIGLTLADAGFRAVLVDLRGHGESTGEWLTYGIIESQDLVQALNDLASRDLLTEPVGVWGSSYGGSVGLQLAGVDPRVKAVVAIAPFASVRDLIPRYARQWGVGWLLSDATIDEAVRRAGELAGCDLTDADPVAAGARSNARILLIHGRDDSNIPCEHSERIASAAGERARLMLLEDEDHVSIMRDLEGVIAREAVAWLHAQLSAQ